MASSRIPSSKDSHYEGVFDKQDFNKFKTQASEIAKCTESLFWRKGSFEPCDKIKKFDFFKYITKQEKSSEISESWAKLLQSKIDRALTSGEIDLFKQVKESFYLLSIKDKTNENYNGAYSVMDCICYNADEQSPPEQERIKKLSLEATSRLSSILEKTRFNSADLNQYLEDKEEEGPSKEKKLRQSAKKEEYTVQSTKLERSQSKCSKLILSSISIVAVAIMVFYKYNHLYSSI